VPRLRLSGILLPSPQPSPKGRGRKAGAPLHFPRPLGEGARVRESVLLFPFLTIFWEQCPNDRSNGSEQFSISWRYSIVSCAQSQWIVICSSSPGNGNVN
jgi:hypothetical protein